MKKISMFSLVFLLSAMMMGCGGGNNDAQDNTNNNNATGTEGNNDGNNNGNALDNEDLNTDNTGQDENANIEVADEVADRISEMEEVDTATVLITDQNAYVAVVLNGGTDTDTDTNTDTNTNTDTDTEMAEELQTKIADQVREVDENIQNVYVSSNPEFIERWTGFRDRINAGDPIEGFFEEFTQAVENVFPNRQ